MPGSADSPMVVTRAGIGSEPFFFGHGKSPGVGTKGTERISISRLSPRSPAAPLGNPVLPLPSAYSILGSERRRFRFEKVFLAGPRPSLGVVYQHYHTMWVLTSISPFKCAKLRGGKKKSRTRRQNSEEKQSDGREKRAGSTKMVGKSRKTAKEKQLHAINYNFTVLIFHYILSKQEATSALGTARPNTMQGGHFQSCSRSCTPDSKTPLGSGRLHEERELRLTRLPGTSLRSSWSPFPPPPTPEG